MNIKVCVYVYINMISQYMFSYIYKWVNVPTVWNKITCTVYVIQIYTSICEWTETGMVNSCVVVI